MTHRGNEDTAPSISPSTAMKYVFVLIWSLIPSKPFHGPFPYANTSGGERERQSAVEARSEEETHLGGRLAVCIV